jgi:hypothetical protein
MPRPDPGRITRRCEVPASKQRQPPLARSSATISHPASTRSVDQYPTGGRLIPRAADGLRNTGLDDVEPVEEVLEHACSGSCGPGIPTGAQVTALERLTLGMPGPRIAAAVSTTGSMPGSPVPEGVPAERRAVRSVSTTARAIRFTDCQKIEQSLT